MTDELDDLLEDDTWDDDTGAEDAADAPAAQPNVAAKKLEAQLKKEQEARAAEQAALVGALKGAWGSAAATEFPLANIEDIPLKGIDDKAKEEFLAEVKARHEAEEHRLAQAGYVRTDEEGKPIIPTPAASPEDAERGRLIAAGWSPPVGGSEAAPIGEEQQVRKEIVESMSGGPKAVLDTMFKRSRIGEFMVRKD